MDSQRAQILVVDDEKLIRWSAGERLAKAYDVLAAETGEQALEVLAARRPSLMLLDIKLPGLDGLTVLKRALALRPDMVVLMMSAHGTIDTAVEAMTLGAVDFLVKPFTLTALEDRVGRALATARVRQQLAAPSQAAMHAASPLVGSSAPMRELKEKIARVAGIGASTVLVDGESGVGKELVARAIHEGRSHAAGPFMQINCAALPETLFETELFGHERGAFTDARTQKQGLLEVAAGGSVMLDEIGDLSPGGQAKLLRLLEQKTFRRVGGTAELHAEVRIIAATNVELKQRIAEGRFRADLFFRLNVVNLRVPPLRERKDDIPELVSHFLAHYNRELKQAVKGVSPPALAALQAYDWPGNVRELRSVIERALILHSEMSEVRPEHLPPEVRGTAGDPPDAASPGPAERAEFGPLLDAERRLIQDAMEKVYGNQSAAARMLGISRDTLRYRLKKHQL